jgi:hypothetical protein
MVNFPAKSIAIRRSVAPIRQIRLFNRWFDQRYLSELKTTPGTWTSAGTWM